MLQLSKILFYQEGKKEGPKDTVIVVGAASMGVLKRDHQHDPHLFQVYYPPNPFDNVTTQEIENYTADIERKRRIGGKSKGRKDLNEC